MTQQEIEELKLCLTCALSSYSSKLLTSLSLGTCPDGKVENIIIASALLDTICGYQGNCISDYAFEVDIDFIELSDEVLADIDNGTIPVDNVVSLIAGNLTLATFTGDTDPSGTTDNIISAFNTQINANTGTTGFMSYINDDGNLIVWSCTFESKVYPIVTEQGSPILGNLLITQVDKIPEFEDTTSMEAVNNITENQLCAIIDKFKKLTK